ncbi:hypothetical protein PAXINDRAFT_95960 [Paxillus involutus ATCC 200175]|nr:hypothetical protein PAXINDRAFT_95960 [Paxillus involutus ATCC 200175]
MEDVRHKANSLVHAPDSNPWPHDNSCFGDISPMHDGPEVIPSPAPPNGSTVVPRECVRERDVSLGNLDLIKTDLGDGYTRREDGSLVFHSDGEARVRVIHDLVLAPPTIRPVSSS